MGGYVLGTVLFGRFEMRADEQGYRSVRGSPTLGGDGAPPVLVYAGDERGLIVRLARDASEAHLLGVGAACICGLLAVGAVFLASL